MILRLYVCCKFVVCGKVRLLQICCMWKRINKVKYRNKREGLNDKCLGQAYSKLYSSIKHCLQGPRLQLRSLGPGSFRSVKCCPVLQSISQQCVIYTNWLAERIHRLLNGDERKFKFVIRYPFPTYNNFCSRRLSNHLEKYMEKFFTLSLI